MDNYKELIKFYDNISWYLRERIADVFAMGYEQGYEDGRKNKTEDLWKCYKYGVLEGKQKGFEKCSECKYKDATLCKTEPLHEEDEDGNCVDFMPEDSESTQPPRRKWAIVKPNWKQIPKCRDCKYLNSSLMPCNKCKDNSQFEPAEERQTEKSCSNCLLEGHCKYYGKTLTWLLGDENEQTGEKVCKSWTPNMRKESHETD